jgi:hypothetical protein
VPSAVRWNGSTTTVLTITSSTSALVPSCHLLACRAGGGGSRGALQVRAGTISTNDFKVGTSIEVSSAPWKVVEFMHVKPGKGSAFVRSKLKNYITGGTNEMTFRAGEKVTLADVVGRCRLTLSNPS